VVSSRQLHQRRPQLLARRQTSLGVKPSSNGRFVVFDTQESNVFKEADEAMMGSKPRWTVPGLERLQIATF
jgi:hypothetical protein